MKLRDKLDVGASLSSEESPAAGTFLVSVTIKLHEASTCEWDRAWFFATEPTPCDSQHCDRVRSALELGASLSVSPLPSGFYQLLSDSALDSSTIPTIDDPQASRRFIPAVDLRGEFCGWLEQSGVQGASLSVPDSSRFPFHIQPLANLNKGMQNGLDRSKKEGYRL
ncbi:hypothetical protein PGTUg99_011051 [Puccinia graminis f. sp. tritici]|uniref:Uncharacterized protein n=1 Tax=Puccinia graminis f. sp. tritici TaxID=56615 RepID=A0A5B0RFQ3_PUCGR|nr:hypothetical protein PGTUg99_011051 [Puccinia graminis f. sp. tritici]